MYVFINMYVPKYVVCVCIYVYMACERIMYVRTCVLINGFSLNA